MPQPRAAAARTGWNGIRPFPELQTIGSVVAFCDLFEVGQPNKGIPGFLDLEAEGTAWRKGLRQRWAEMLLGYEAIQLKATEMSKPRYPVTNRRAAQQLDVERLARDTDKMVSGYVRNVLGPIAKAARPPIAKKSAAPPA